MGCLCASDDCRPERQEAGGLVEEEQIVDKSHKKPENYDQIPKTIPDPEAKQPEEWNKEADGEWEAPEIDNPDFVAWEPKMMPNPAYKGEWKPVDIPNPDFQEYPSLAHYRIGGIGLDLWQVKSGSIFNDIVMTTDKEVADRYLGQWRKNFAVEKELVEELEAGAAKEREAKDKEAKENEEMKAEAEAKAAEEGKKANKETNKETKVETDGFEELDELDDEQPDQNRHDEL